MKRETSSEQTENQPVRKPSPGSSRTNVGTIQSHNRIRPTEGQRFRSFGKEFPLGPTRAAFTSNMPSTQSPGEPPGLLFDSCRPTESAEPEESSEDDFHSRELDDVYDLYNACNGAMRNGMLDIRKLDQLSQEEAEALDVPRLRDLWVHIASGCTDCETIIATLNMARKTMRKGAISVPKRGAP
jgi:hypothetical protein